MSEPQIAAGEEVANPRLRNARLGGKLRLSLAAGDDCRTKSRGEVLHDKKVAPRRM